MKPNAARLQPQPSIAWGVDQRVSSRPNAVCQMTSKHGAEREQPEAGPDQEQGAGHRIRQAWRRGSRARTRVALREL